MKKKTMITGALCGLLLLSLPLMVQAEGIGRRAGLRSHGIFSFQDAESGKNVTLDSADLYILADEIDELESTYKVTTLESLNDMNTYFTADGLLTHRAGEADGQPSGQDLSMGSLTDAIRHTQDIYGTYRDGSGSTQDVETATADNLTLGKGAWVNGTYLIGNGADNDYFYNKGVTDGLARALDSVSIRYNYHTHSGSPSSPGGCYAYTKHTHVGDKSKKGGCYTVYHAAHGGETCGGTYTQMTDTDGNPINYWRCSGFCDSVYPYNPGSPCTNKSKYYPAYYSTSCGNQPLNDGIALTCGKSTSTIESATIIFP